MGGRSMMERALLALAITIATAVAMEGAATLLHRYWMHGPGWALHRSHHCPRQRLLEPNDLYAVVFAAAAIAAIGLGNGPWWPLYWVGAGMTLYGLLYLFVHDGLVHGRFRLPWRPRGDYVDRLVQAHRLHHGVADQHGSVAHGFLLAPPQTLLQQWRQAQVASLRLRRGA